MIRFLSGLLLLLLLSCTPPGGPAPGPVPEQVDKASILTQLAALPGVLIDSGDRLSFSYPDQAMFAAGAVLPLPGGTRVLDPLAAFLLRNPDLVWRVDVRAATRYGEDYDQNLAEKRSELIATYLLKKGVGLHNLHFHPAAVTGEPLVFTLNLSPGATNQ
jgi:outer membrane protein OmpA-like peptidoglycan-associated protein